MLHGQKHVERIPAAWADQVRQRVEAGREFQDAVREVFRINAQLLALSKKQARAKHSSQRSSSR
jgi:hypothetical protein